MKKQLLFFCFLITLQTAFAQGLSQQSVDKRIDSLQKVLVRTNKPVDRFNILLAISETISFNAGDPDSALCTQLLQIAQELRNNSLPEKFKRFLIDEIDAAK